MEVHQRIQNSLQAKTHGYDHHKPHSPFKINQMRLELIKQPLLQQHVHPDELINSGLKKSENLWIRNVHHHVHKKKRR